MQRMTGMSHTCMGDVVRGTRSTGRHSPTQIDTQAAGTVSAPGQSWGASPARWLEASGRGETSTQGHRAGLRQEQGHTGAGRSCRADNARHLKHVGRAPGGHVSISGRTDLMSQMRLGVLRAAVSGDKEQCHKGNSTQGQAEGWERAHLLERWGAEVAIGSGMGCQVVPVRGDTSPAGAGLHLLSPSLPPGRSARGREAGRRLSGAAQSPSAHRPALVRRPALGPCLGQKDCVWATTCCWNLILFLLSHPPSIYGKHTGHHSGLHHSFPFK